MIIFNNNQEINELTLFPEYASLENAHNSKNRHRRIYANQKDRDFGLEHCSGALFSGRYGFPLIRAYKGEIPQSIITFNEMTKTGDSKGCVSFYNQDYLIERFWNNPDRYLLRLSNYLCVAEPDFSLKVNAPLSVQIGNKFRNHALAYKMQSHGIDVLPSMAWSNSRSFDFCFDGHEKGGVVMLSTVGIIRDERSLRFFVNGFSEMLKRVSPDALIIYGELNEEMVKIIPSQLDVHCFQNTRFKRMRNYGQ